MSDSKNPTNKESNGQSLEELAADEKLEITIKKDTNEVTIRNLRDNRVVKLKANLEDAIQEQFHGQRHIEDEKAPRPLTPEEFEEALRAVDDLGLTFTPELFPSVVAKKGNSEILNSEQLEELKEKYPSLPREVGLVVYNTFTLQTLGIDGIGGVESFERKSESVKKNLVNHEFRDEFFFRHALKVPYFESIDWEVVLKTHERGVEGVVGIPYALLMLTFHNTNIKAGKDDIHQNVTVAVNRHLIDKLLATLTKVRASLAESEKIREMLSGS